MRPLKFQGHCWTLTLHTAGVLSTFVTTVSQQRIGKGDIRTLAPTTLPQSPLPPTVQLESGPGPHSCHSLPPGLSGPLACPACSTQDPQAQRAPRPCCAHSVGGRAGLTKGQKCAPLRAPPACLRAGGMRGAAGSHPSFPLPSAGPNVSRVGSVASSSQGQVNCSGFGSFTEAGGPVRRANSVSSRAWLLSSMPFPQTAVVIVCFSLV